MLVFRSLVVGLSAGCLMLLATRTVYVVHAPAPPAAIAPAHDVTIVDVAPDVGADRLPALVHLAPGEHVVAVDDRPIANDLDAGVAISARARGARSFVDLDIAGAAGVRRVLVLVH